MAERVPRDLQSLENLLLTVCRCLSHLTSTSIGHDYLLKYVRAQYWYDLYHSVDGVNRASLTDSEYHHASFQPLFDITRS